MVVPTSLSPSTREVQTGGSGVQGHSGLHGEFEASLDCVSENIKRNRYRQIVECLSGVRKEEVQSGAP